MIRILRGLIEGYELDIDESYLSPQEQSYVKFIRDSYDNSGSFPSTDLLSTKFPELHFESVTGEDILLSEQDTRVHLANLIKSRENLKQSQMLMKLAGQVSQTGLTADIIDQLSGQTVTKTEVEDILESPESFRNYFDAKSEKPEGLVTNVDAIDKRIGGIPYGTVMTIAAFTSQGKSLWGNNIMFHNAYNLKYNVCILSLEVPKTQVFANLLVRLSNEPQFINGPRFSARDLEKGRLTPEQTDFVFNELVPTFYDYENHGMIKILDESDISDTKMSTMKELLIKADDECRQKTGYPLDGILVDHIQLMKFGNNSSRSDMEKINESVSFFHKLAQDFRKIEGSVQQLSVIILSQINRDGYKRAQKRKGSYSITAIADGNEVERASQIIATIFMDNEQKIAGEALLCLLKNRSGETFDDPESVFVSPQNYVFGGDKMDGFADGLEMNELESVFSEGSIADLL